jgi:hypothetical protein
MASYMRHRPLPSDARDSLNWEPGDVHEHVELRPEGVDDRLVLDQQTVQHRVISICRRPDRPRGTKRL